MFRNRSVGKHSPMSEQGVKNRSNVQHKAEESHEIFCGVSGRLVSAPRPFWKEGAHVQPHCTATIWIWSAPPRAEHHPSPANFRAFGAFSLYDVAVLCLVLKRICNPLAKVR